jgi:hypothetical protein
MHSERSGMLAHIVKRDGEVRDGEVQDGPVLGKSGVLKGPRGLVTVRSGHHVRSSNRE